MTGPKIVIDANVLVALVDTKDKWHHQAVELRDALVANEAQLIYFDCVVNETVSVLGRRAEEQRRSEQFDQLLAQLSAVVPAESITWISAAAQRLFLDILSLCRFHEGRLNFNDALMALVSQELGIGHILSFDKDFDHISFLSRLAVPGDVASLS